MMPGLDGAELAALLHKLPTPKIRLIAFWSASHKERLRELHKKTGFPVFSKSVSPTKVVKQLEKLAASSKPT